jgi:hypothetical protein
VDQLIPGGRFSSVPRLQCRWAASSVTELLVKDGKRKLPRYCSVKTEEFLTERRAPSGELAKRKVRRRQRRGCRVARLHGYDYGALQSDRISVSPRRSSTSTRTRKLLAELLHRTRTSPTPFPASTQSREFKYCTIEAAVALCIGNVGCKSLSQKYSLTAYAQLSSFEYHVGAPLHIC